VDINQTNGEPVSRIATEREIPADCRNLVNRLINARLLVSDEVPAGADGKKPTTYRVAHEALLRRWDWLKGVLDLQAGQLSTAQLIERQAEAWDRAKREKTWLDLRGDRLHEALKLARRVDFKRRLTGVPADYVSACRKRALKTKLVIGGALSLLALGAVGAGAAYIQQLADRERIVADAERIEADRKRISTRAEMVEGVLAGFARPGVLDDAAERALKRGENFKECDSCPEMVVLPPGEVMMGSPETEKDRDRDEGPQRKVTIARSFAVGKFEVTFAEWEACVAGGGCTANKSPTDRGWGKATRPVINVAWNDARQYVEWLSVRTGKTYRLLTEAEWEYAARAGTTTAYSWGNDIGEGNANCDGCKSQWDNKQTAPVGSFKPNDFGLHDMHGNVWEWVQDCHGDYSKAPNDGAAAPETGNCSRVLRGGSWNLYSRNLRAAGRLWNAPDVRDSFIGFRVARDLTPARAN
jgi:formylglycine-generating enzyme required for sulfatase activity